MFIPVSVRSSQTSLIKSICFFSQPIPPYIALPSFCAGRYLVTRPTPNILGTVGTETLRMPTVDGWIRRLLRSNGSAAPSRRVMLWTPGTVGAGVVTGKGARARGGAVGCSAVCKCFRNSEAYAGNLRANNTHTCFQHNLGLSIPLVTAAGPQSVIFYVYCLCYIPLESNYCNEGEGS